MVKMYLFESISFHQFELRFLRNTQNCYSANRGDQFRKLVKQHHQSSEMIEVDRGGRLRRNRHLEEICKNLIFNIRGMEKVLL